MLIFRVRKVVFERLALDLVLRIGLVCLEIVGGVVTADGVVPFLDLERDLMVAFLIALTVLLARG